MFRVESRSDWALIFFSLLQGAVLYGHYGQESDFTMLQNKNVDLSGRVLLVRAGRNSFAEKVRGGPALQPSCPSAASSLHWFSSRRWPMQPS